MEIFKIYYHPDLVLNKNQFTEIDELAKKYTIFTPYCVNALILIIKTSSSIIVEMDRLARELPEYETVSKMDGVGTKLIIRIIAEIGDIRR